MYDSCRSTAATSSSWRCWRPAPCRRRRAPPARSAAISRSASNGAREDFNNYILDGVYNVDPKLNTSAVRPPVDAIREFEVATSTYDASFGRNAADRSTS